MKEHVLKILAVFAFIVSLPLQYVTAQAFRISLIVFLVYLAGNLVYVWNTKESIKVITKDPVMVAITWFLIGTSIVRLYNGAKTAIAQKQDSKDKKEMITSYLSYKLIAYTALEYLDEKNLDPNSERLDSLGIINENSMHDLICGLYYDDNKHADYAKARNYYRKASPNNSLARGIYGDFVYYGIADIPSDEGYKYIEDAAKLYVPEAQYRMLGFCAKTNSLEEAEKWYKSLSRYETAILVDLYFSNDILRNYVESNNGAIGQKVIDDVIDHYFTLSSEAYILMTSLQVQNKKPYAAIRLSEEYWNSIIKNEKDRDKKKQYRLFLEAYKYRVFMNTGNKRKAMMIEKKYNSIFNGSFYRNIEVINNIPIEVNYRIK